MDSIRQQIFDRIRNALGRRELSSEEMAALEQRLVKHPNKIRPKWSEPDLERFVTKLKKAAASVTRISDINQIPEEMSRYCDEHQTTREILMCDETELVSLDWKDISVKTGRNDGSYQVGFSRAYSAIAETGTVVLLSSGHSPTTLNFLSEHHIILVYESDLVSHMEDLWKGIRAERINPRRAVNLITGPSRTADIEQTIQLGAHGPRYLHIIILAA